MAESFVKTIKRDYVAHMPKPDRETALRNLAIAFEHYNEQHPHSALNYRSPSEFRRLKSHQFNGELVSGFVGASPVMIELSQRIGARYPYLFFTPIGMGHIQGHVGSNFIAGTQAENAAIAAGSAWSAMCIVGRRFIKCQACTQNPLRIDPIRGANRVSPGVVPVLILLDGGKQSRSQNATVWGEYRIIDRISLSRLQPVHVLPAYRVQASFRS